MNFYRGLRVALRPLKRIVPKPTKLYADEDFVSCVGKKKSGFLYQADKIETIALHSSVADYGFLASAADNSFNLGLTSSDLHTDYYVYKCARKYSPRLKNIVVFASVFAPGYNLEKASDRYRCVAYRYFFDVPLRHNEEFQSNLISRVERRCRKASAPQVSVEYSGYDKKPYYDVSAKDRARTHLRENCREPHQMEWLQRLLSDATNAGHRVYIIIPPFRSDYKKELERSVRPGEIFRKYYSLNLESHQILDYYSSGDFGDECLGDTDHLNEEGARRLTREIMKQVSGSMA